MTHDEESALKYSDEILRFDTANVDLDVSSQNEQVVEPNTNKEVTTNNKLVLKRAKVPLATITKLAFKNMWHKKFSYILMFVICTISLAFLSFAIELMVTNFIRMSTLPLIITFIILISINIMIHRTILIKIFMTNIKR